MSSSDLTTEELLHLAEDMLREDREYLESFNAAVHYRAALEIEDRVSGHEVMAREPLSIRKLTLLIASERDGDTRRRLLSELHSALRSEQAIIKKNVDEFVKRYPVAPRVGVVG